MRAILANWEQGDFRSVDWADPEIEFVIADGPTPGSWTGVAGMAAGWTPWLGAWENFRVVVDELRELDDERVLALTHGSGRGKRSGLTGEQMRTEGASIFHLDAGKVTRLVVYFVREDGLRHLGLPSETETPR